MPDSDDLTVQNADRQPRNSQQSFNGAFFESAAHQEMVLDCISRGILPLKFAYAGSAAETHDALARSDDYQNTVGSARLEAAAIRTLNPSPTVTQDIVEVGPGNGQHTAAFLASLVSEGYAYKRYLGLDFSERLLEIAVGRIHNNTGNDPAGLQTGQWDVETDSTSKIEEWRGERPLLACLLGNTLGNVEDPHTVLLNLQRSLRPDDLLLLGLAAKLPRGTEDSYLTPYQNDVFRRAALEPLRAAGIDLNHVDFKLRYRDDAVMGYAEVKQPIILNGVKLESGHIVRCFLSRRFERSDVADLLLHSGWSVQISDLDSTGSHLATLARCTP